MFPRAGCGCRGPHRRGRGARRSARRSRAAALEPGKVYYLRIDAGPGKVRAAAQTYEARFCLAKQRDGSAIVHQIRDGERPGKRLFGCLPPER